MDRFHPELAAASKANADMVNAIWALAKASPESAERIALEHEVVARRSDFRLARSALKASLNETAL